jgi:hypothetical protein
MKKTLIAFGMSLVIVTAGFGMYMNQTPEKPKKLGAFSDPFLSLQVGTSPQNGYYLQTDGTNSTWAAVTASGGSGGGSWSTTTSQVAGQFINYPNNTTDVVAIGSTATTTAEFYYDPNAFFFFVKSASSTIAGPLDVIGNFRLPSLSQGFAYIGSGGKVNSIASSSINLSWLNNDIGFGSAAYEIATGTIAVPELAYFTKTGGRTTLGSVATTSLAVGASLSNSGTLGSQIGGTASSLSINTANTNTWSVLQNFNYSSSTVYSSFLTASSTFLNAGSLTIATSSAGCASFMSSGLLVSTGSACGSGSGGGSDPFTHPLAGLSATTTQILIGTSTASNYQLTVASSTAPQLALSDGAGLAQWSFRNAGGNLYIGTTTAAGTATTSTAALTLTGNGKPGLGIGTSTDPGAQFATLAVNPLPGDFANQFVVGSSTGTSLRINNGGKIFIPSLTVDAAAHTYTMCGEATTFEARWDTTTCALSALKFKENIKDLDIGLKELMEVRPVSFDWKPTGDVNYDNNINVSHEQIGVIADEVEKIDKRLVTYDKNGEIKGFNYEFYTAWLTQAIQELAEMKGVKRGMEENWQSGLIGLLILYVIYNEVRRYKK